MTSTKIRRAHDDPEWSGRLVEGADGGWAAKDCTLHHLRQHLLVARDLAGSMGGATRPWDLEGQAVLPVAEAERMAELYELVDNLQRGLPLVQGWCCGYEISSQGPRGNIFQVRSAHQSLFDASDWLPWWKEAEHGHGWMILFTPAPILAFRHHEADPRRFVGSLASELW